MLSGEDFGYLKNEEQNKITTIAKKAFLLGAVLFSISCFIYITMNAYYFVYHDKDSNIKVIKSPPEPIKVVEENSGIEIKDIDKTIYDNIVSKQNLARENLNNVKVIEQVKTPLVKREKIEGIKVDNNSNPAKISTGEIVVNEKQIKSTKNNNEMVVYDDKQSRDVGEGKVNDASLTSKHSANKPSKSMSRVQIAALSSKDSAVKYWSSLKKSQPKLFANLEYFLSETKNNKGKFYRLQIGNFRSQIEAESFCRQFISKFGKSTKANCIIVE